MKYGKSISDISRWMCSVEMYVFLVNKTKIHVTFKTVFSSTTVAHGGKFHFRSTQFMIIDFIKSKNCTTVLLLVVIT